jgi:hypothetical protein
VIDLLHLDEKMKASAAAVPATALVAVACALMAEARALMAANAAAEASAKPTTNSGAKHAAKSYAKSSTNSDAKTRRIHRHLAVRKLAGKILSLLLPRRHFGCLELRNTQLLKLILKIGHGINLQ